MKWRFSKKGSFQSLFPLLTKSFSFWKNFETNQSDTQKSLKLVELSNEIETILKEKNELQSTKDKELIELEEKWSQDYKKVKNEKDDLFMSKFLFAYI